VFGDQFDEREREREERVSELRHVPATM